MPQLLTKLTKQAFKKILSGNKTYVPRSVNKELRDAGMGHLLHKSTVTKQQALKAIKHLQGKPGEKGHLSRLKGPAATYRKAARKQLKQEQVVLAKKGAIKAKKLQEQKVKLAAKRKNRLKTYLLLERDEELAAEERGKKRIEYDPRSVLGQDQLEEREGELEGLEGKDQGIKRVEYAPGGDLPQTVSEEIEEKKKKREKKVASEQEKIQEFFNPKSVKPKKPDLVDIDNLPDMDIG
jgi:hypothetical protein